MKKEERRRISFDVDLGANEAIRERSVRFDTRREKGILAALGAILLPLMAGTLIFRTDLTVTGITPALIWSESTARAENLWCWLTGGPNVNAASFSVYTILIVALVGAALAVSGAVCQGLFHTPMASPSMLGIQSGGMLAAVIFLFFFVDPSPVEAFCTSSEYCAYLDTLSFSQLFGRQLFVLAGCILGGSLVLLISGGAGRGRVSGVILILTGSLFSSLAGSVVSLGQYYFTYVDPTPDRAYGLMSISMGTFANTYSLTHLLLVAVPLVLSMAALFAMAPAINALMFGDREAMAMGVNVGRVRNIAFLLCIIPCAVILAFCGRISFVGLIIPHIARQMLGSDCRWLLPGSALLGAVSLVLVYQAALCTGLTAGINLITSVVGGVLFLGFILKYRRCRNGDWA